MNIDQLVRSHIKSLKPYSSARDEYAGSEGIFMDANENPFGSSLEGNYNRYPDPYQADLKKAISDVKKISEKHIFLGNGSDEPIDLIIRLFCNPGKNNIIITPPTYGMYEVAAEINEVEIVRVPLNEEFELKPREILDQVSGNSRLLFLCSPNNPSGNSFRKDDIKFLIREFPGIVVLDEAYIDFCPEKSLLHEIDKYENLIILQTFSKAWGLAGLRLGMAFTHPEIIQYLNKIKPPYNISQVTQQLAMTALKNVGKKESFVTKIMNEVAYLKDELKKYPVVQKIYPSDTNFLLVKFEDTSEVFQYLINQKIIVRDRSNLELCEGTLRITAGTRTENEKFLNALNQYTRTL